MANIFLLCLGIGDTNRESKSPCSDINILNMCLNIEISHPVNVNSIKTEGNLSKMHPLLFQAGLRMFL